MKNLFVEESQKNRFGLEKKIHEWYSFKKKINKI
jgi:hypothetical protein